MQVIETQITAPAVAAAVTRDIVTSKGKVTGTEFIFEMGDTKALKEAIKSAHPDWGNKRISREVAVLRADKMAASRLQADAFVGMQFAKGRTAVLGKDRNSGKSSLHFEDCNVEADGTAILKAAAQKLADKMGWTLEAAIEALK
jgi:hypothetical protein